MREMVEEVEEIGGEVSGQEVDGLDDRIINER